MSLTLILGPANSAKAGEVLGGYSAAPDALLVVPTATDAEHYARELATEGALLGSVLTFAGLAREIGARVGSQPARLSDIGCRRAMRRVLAEVELRSLGGSASTPGFVRAATELIFELERSLITPQRFAQALGTWAGEDEALRGYARELGRLYRAYAEELDRVGRVDGYGFAWRALDALRTRPAAWGQTSVFFYGFDDLVRLERDAVETLARVVGCEVTVSLTYEPGRAALGARAPVVEELRSFADRVRELSPLQEHYLPGSRAALHHLERFLYEPDPPRIDPGDAVRLLEAGGELAQAELVAAAVLAQLRAGVPAHEIVVVCRSLAAAAPALAGALERYGLTTTSHRVLPFTHTAIGRTLRSLARCAFAEQTEAGADELIDLLRWPDWLVRTERADELEAEIRRAGLRTAEQALERAGRVGDELRSLREADDLAAELVSRGRRLLATPREGEAAVLSHGEELDARALAALHRAVDELQSMGERLRVAELLELLEELEVGVGGGWQEEAILLAEPLEIRARRFRVVIVCGLDEGEFPAPGRPEPFLSDEYRRELAMASGLRLPEREDSLSRERYLFYACVSRASEQVVLGYRSSDEEGNLVLPSPFLADVAALFTADWPERRERRLLADVVWDPARAPTEEERARAWAAGGSGQGGSPEPLQRTLREVTLELVRHREVVSAGALESFCDCPVKWLVERQLEPAPLSPGSDPVERGTFMHSALEEVIGRLSAPLTEETLPDALRILDDVVAELPVAVAPGRGEAVRTALVQGYVADLRRYLAEEAGDGCDWTPTGLEVRFGFDEEGSLPAVRLGVGEERVELRGMIDRVDVDPGGTRAVVRDYKSGARRPEQAAARWSSDRRLQVPLYMIAVRELLGLDPVAGFYQPLTGRDLRPRGAFLDGEALGSRVMSNDGCTTEELDQALRDARERALAASAGIRRGVLTPCPQTCSRDGCAHPGICRSG